LDLLPEALGAGLDLLPEALGAGLDLLQLYGQQIHLRAPCVPARDVFKVNPEAPVQAAVGLEATGAVGAR